jgi:hypothetical protein
MNDVSYNARPGSALLSLVGVTGDEAQQCRRVLSQLTLLAPDEVYMFEEAPPVLLKGGKRPTLACVLGMIDGCPYTVDEVIELEKSLSISHLTLSTVRQRAQGFWYTDSAHFAADLRRVWLGHLMHKSDSKKRKKSTSAMVAAATKLEGLFAKLFAALVGEKKTVCEETLASIAACPQDSVLKTLVLLGQEDYDSVPQSTKIFVLKWLVDETLSTKAFRAHMRSEQDVLADNMAEHRRMVRDARKFPLECMK